MRSPRPPPPDYAARPGYVIALIGAVCAVGLRETVTPYFGSRTFLLFYVPVVLVSATLGGRYPALLAAGLCIGLGALALDGRVIDDPANRIDLATFILLSLLIAFAGGHLRRQAREAANRRLHLESILRTVPDAMVVIDERGVIISFSAAAIRTFGWSAEEVVGRNITLLMPEPDRSKHDGYLNAFRTTGEHRIIGVGRVVTGLRKDGSVFPLELSVGATGGDAGRYFTGFMRDLTERRTQETKTQSLQAQLAHAGRITAMGEMASTLAHEINQPLTAVANYMQGASALVESGDPDLRRLKTALDAAADQALRAGEIIRHLRAFVDKEQAPRTLIATEVLVQEALTLALMGVSEHQLRLKLDLEADLPKVLVDPIQIQQVIVNLVRNALDAMPAPPIPMLTIRSRQDLKRRHVAITVADRGSGLPAATVGHLFEPFVSGGGEGLGLGLSICRTIIEAHGGRLTARNRAHGGAMFCFTLPFIPEGDHAA